MALREIRKIGDDILRKKCRVVENVDNRIVQLMNDMAETMYKAEGVGLAAPQVGILKRVIVVDVGENLVKLANPEIVKAEGNQIDDEGCLSVPNQRGSVDRPQHVTVKGINEKGEEVLVEGEDFFARALCHEIDHLDGILFVDKMEKQ